MAGRPPLRIGQHGKISRQNLGGGVWVARCRYRDSDGVTRIVERRGRRGREQAEQENRAQHRATDRAGVGEPGHVVPIRSAVRAHRLVWIGGAALKALSQPGKNSGEHGKLPSCPGGRRTLVGATCYRIDIYSDLRKRRFRLRDDTVKTAIQG